MPAASSVAPQICSDPTWTSQRNWLLAGQRQPSYLWARLPCISLEVCPQTEVSMCRGGVSGGFFPSVQPASRGASDFKAGWLFLCHFEKFVLVRDDRLHPPEGRGGLKEILCETECTWWWTEACPCRLSQLGAVAIEAQTNEAGEFAGTPEDTCPPSSPGGPASGENPLLFCEVLKCTDRASFEIKIPCCIFRSYM